MSLQTHENLVQHLLGHGREPPMMFSDRSTGFSVLVVRGVEAKNFHHWRRLQAFYVYSRQTSNHVLVRKPFFFFEFVLKSQNGRVCWMSLAYPIVPRYLRPLGACSSWNMTIVKNSRYSSFPSELKYKWSILCLPTTGPSQSLPNLLQNRKPPTSLPHTPSLPVSSPEPTNQPKKKNWRLKIPPISWSSNTYTVILWAQ